VPVAEIVRLTLRDLAADVALCDEHRSALDAMLVPALQLSRRSIERRVPSQRGSGFPRLRADEDREAIREWARAQGLPVAASGTISAAVLESYRAAHNKQRA
jgi:hypothetical protein